MRSVWFAMPEGPPVGRQRTNRTKTPAESDGKGPVAGVYPIDTGTCELQPDGYRPNGWLIRINDVQSSHVDLDDPAYLEFEYMRWIAGLVDAHWSSDARLRALHLGAGACSLARHLAATYPNARQVAVELDGKLAERVRDWFDLPRAPLLRIRVGEAREVTESLTEDSRDLIIRDVFSGSKTPKPLTTKEFTVHVRRVLAPGGIYAVNCGDGPDLTTARREAATITAAFAHTIIVADPAMLKGRRYGNMVIAGSDTPIGDDARFIRGLLTGGLPAHVWHDIEVRRFGNSSGPFTD